MLYSVTSNLQTLHETLCHPGIIHLMHFVHSKNFSFSVKDIKASLTTPMSVELSSQFYHPVIKATQLLERLCWF